MGQYAQINGLKLYYEIHGAGAPLVLVHGGLWSTGVFADLLPVLARDRQVIALDLQAHGRTANIDRPMTYTAMGDDIAGLIRHLGFNQADVLGYSLGGGAALRAAIQHPALVRKLVLVSTPFKRSGWFPEVLAGMESVGPQMAEAMRPTPMYAQYAAVAPRPEDWPVLLGKVGGCLRLDYDWSAEVAGITAPTMLIYGDADSISPNHAAQFFALLGGGTKDGNWDGSGISRHRLAILPGLTHYSIFPNPATVATATKFLSL
ncbi:MAG: alpha/beta hydrolase fold protein [Hyphomicrobiales bacterium]|nr:alpha/beta hydrolase fold protein [Hyphomicrobiales bacterium]